VIELFSETIKELCCK